MEKKGLTYEGLMHTYNDHAGDVDHNFDTVGLELKRSLKCLFL